LAAGIAVEDSAAEDPNPSCSDMFG